MKFHPDEAIHQALVTDQTIDISTHGRRSGKIRRIEIWFTIVAEKVYITGTPGKRDWYANLLAKPEFTFHLKETIQADLAARAHPVFDIGDRRKILSSDNMRWYHKNSDSVEAFIEQAPLIEVEFL